MAASAQTVDRASRDSASSAASPPSTLPGVRGNSRNRTPIADLDDALPLDDKLWLIWRRWTDWGTRNPARRRALLLIGVSEYVSSRTRQESELESVVGVELFQEASRTGVLRQQPIRFVGALVEAVANSTMDLMALEPARADEYRLAGYRAMRNMLG